ncbi:MAG: hypothetical protein J6Y37_13445 [Paludibacteraceae bacterium]|nr:hypothetical protein [Paludibacteraceae bacterium]
MVTCLESVSRQERKEEIVRNDYNAKNQYNAQHKNARATGDSKGKGTGHGGHSHWLPNCKGTLGVFNYSNFDTAYKSGAGNNVDNQTRKVAMARSLYTPNKQYSMKIVDTSANVREGQYKMK